MLAGGFQGDAKTVAPSSTARLAVARSRLQSDWFSLTGIRSTENPSWPSPVLNAVVPLAGGQVAHPGRVDHRAEAADRLRGRGRVDVRRRGGGRPGSRDRCRDREGRARPPSSSGRSAGSAIHARRSSAHSDLESCLVLLALRFRDFSRRAAAPAAAVTSGFWRRRLQDPASVWLIMGRPRGKSTGRLMKRFNVAVRHPGISPRNESQVEKLREITIRSARPARGPAGTTGDDRP